MATKKLNSIKGRRMRLTRLDSCGAPVIGACSTVVTSGFITVTWAPEVKTGDEYLQENAWGDFCVNERDPDRFKWVNVSLELCEVDPDILDIVAQGNPVTDGTDTIGSTFGTTPNVEAFALEVWTKQAGGACSGGSPEWGYFVTPFVKNGRLDGDLSVSNGTLSVSMTGMGFAATDDWGVGPYGDNPLLAAAGFPVGDLFGLVRTTVQPPDVTDGCEALA
jgi:hypothetical protein